MGMAEKGAANAKLPLLKVLHQSIMGGCYVGFGGLLSIVIAGVSRVPGTVPHVNMTSLRTAYFTPLIMGVDACRRE